MRLLRLYPYPYPQPNLNPNPKPKPTPNPNLLQAYLDAARRIGYPTDLLNLTGSRSIQDALHRLAPPEERSCLQSAASHGALVSSPSYSSLELLAAICAVASRCGRRLT